MASTLGEIARHINAELDGDPDTLIERIDTIDEAGPGCLSFLYDRSYRKFLEVTRASAVILTSSHKAACPSATLVCDNPYLAYARAAQYLNPAASASGIDASATVHASARVADSAWVGPNAVVEADAVIADGVQIGAGVSIGQGARIGAWTRINANVTVYQQVHIGQHCLIHSGTVIGADGFGFARDGEQWIKIPQLGSVTIGDRVEIGANTTVDRGALKDTMIGNGVIIDNQVQIAHNVVIGDHTAIAGCVGIAGSTRVGKRCQLGGGVGLSGHLDIGDDVIITGMTLVTKSITAAGTYSSGWPAQDARQWRRRVARLNRLDRKS